MRPAAPLLASELALSQHDPALVRVGDRTVAAARLGPAAMGEASVLGHVAVDVFDAWPPPPALLRDTAPLAWAAPPAFSPFEDGTFAVAYLDWPGCVHRAASGLDPTADYPDPARYPASFEAGVGCFRRVRALAGLPSGTRAVASSIQSPAMPDSYTLETVRASPEGTFLTYDEPACALWHLVADLEVLSGEIVIANTNATPTLSCDDRLGVANDVVVGVLGSGVADTTISAVDDIVDVDLLPQPGGASFLLFRESGASARVAPPAMAVELGPDQEQVGEPWPATGAGLTRVAAASIPGGGFVVVSDETLADEATLTLRAFRSDGSLRAEVAVPVGSGSPTNERLAVLTSPDGRAAVVAWSSVDPGGASAVQSARVDCLGD